MDAACQCGAVSFKTPLPKPLAVYICHCDECRRQSSSAFGCSAIFPRFELPCRDVLSVYTRPTASGHTLNCYFCRTCGTRVIHTTPGKSVLSVKGGCIAGLDWTSAKHIWCKRAMVPIPEGVERHEGEPPDDEPGTPKDVDGGVGGGSVWTGGVNGAACFSGSSGGKANGKGKEVVREREREERTGDVEKDIMILTRRLEEKREARRKASEADLRG